MRQGHLPYGYRIENGVAVIDEEQAEQIRMIYKNYLSGKSYADAAASVGLQMYHAGVKRMLQNRHYLGDDFYPALIDKETFDATEEERLKRARMLGRTDKKRKAQDTPPVPISFRLGEVKQKYKDPFLQAAYAYSKIESEG